MRKLAKYLKPFMGGLLLSIVLLFGQAMSDLSLPDFMGDIVNVGIQQNGIENPSPQAISESGMKFMTTFMTETEKEVVAESYNLVLGTDTNEKGKKYNEIYTKADASIYIREEVDTITLEKLDNAFGSATWTFFNIMKDMGNQGAAGNTAKTSLDLSGDELAKLYKIQPMLDMLPPSVIDAAREKASDNDSFMLKQSGIVLSKAFYSELGLDIEKLQTAYIINIGLLMLLIALFGGVATVLVSFISSKIASGVARNLRRDVFDKIENFSNKEFDKYSTASLITRCTNDITQIQMLLMIGIRMLCYAPIMAVGGTILAVNKSASMSWIIAVACTALLGLIMVVVVVAVPKFKAIQKLIDRLNLVSREKLSGMMVIRAFSTQEHEKKRFDVANKDLTATMLFVSRVMVFMMPAMMFIMNGVVVLIVWVGAHQISDSTMQVGDMMAFMQYSMQIIMSFLMISMMFIFIPRASVSADRIAEVLETPISITDPINPKSFDPGKRGMIEFKNVDFRYFGAEEDALSDITFTAMPGRTTAIIGPTGSGKSTIASLLLRFYDVTGGQILVDGVDVRETKQKDLRAKIGYVPQKAVLLSGSIESNLRYAKKDATGEELSDAATIAQAMEFITEKSDGFASEIAQGGENISGGQKQRLSIARALIKKPEILFFDDSFSALDFKTDSALRRELKSRISDITVIVVAQRVSTIMNAEQIIVLDEGRIVGIGTHRELIESCPEYYEIASSQMSKEELA